MRIHKVYTRTGDGGETALLGGQRVPKASQRVECYGGVDELQAHLGLLRAELAAGALPDGAELVPILHTVQNHLFDMGSTLASPPERLHEVRWQVTEEDIEMLEGHMDRWSAELPPLRSFVLAGGGRLSTLAQVARTVCRRVERDVWRLEAEEEVPEPLLRYLNRLSDFLFVLGRHLARLSGEEEPLWSTPLEKGDAEEKGEEKGEAGGGE